MINDLMNKIIQKRLPQIENYIKNPIEVQDKILKTLIKSAQETIWGKFYDYKNIKSWNDFNQKVPISTYEDLKPFFERARGGEYNVLWPTEIRRFSKSSGTTSSKSKFIPVSEECLNECH